MYVIVRSEPQLWTVGHYDPDGKWHSFFDGTREEAETKCHFLNGGERITTKDQYFIALTILTAQKCIAEKKMEALQSIVKQVIQVDFVIDAMVVMLSTEIEETKNQAWELQKLWQS